MRKIQKSKKKAFFGFITGMFEHENIELIILGVLSLIVSIFGHAIYSNHAQIQAEFDTLAMNVRDLSYADNYLYIDCKNKSNATEIFNDINTLRDKLKTLIDQHAAMGNLLTLETNCAIHEFTYWNDQLKDAAENVCLMPLKSEAETDQWRDKILNLIYKNKEIRQGPISSLKEYFFDIYKNVYTYDQCKMNSSLNPSLEPKESN